MKGECGVSIRHLSGTQSIDRRPIACLSEYSDSNPGTDTTLTLQLPLHTPNCEESIHSFNNSSFPQMDPQAPSQPSIDTAYDNPDNPVDQTSAERKDATSTSASQQRSDPTSDRREPNDTIGDRGSASQNEATPSSLGYGARDSSGDAGESVRASLSVLLFGFEQPAADHMMRTDRRLGIRPRRRANARCW